MREAASRHARGANADWDDLARCLQEDLRHGHEAMVYETRLGDRVVRPGRIPDADRDGCYRAAVALAFPSRYEGFGAPVLEAMALGCPVVAADATALPEVVGDAGLLVTPGDVSAWRDALAGLADDGAEQARLAAAGIARARHFTATVTAQALLSAYRGVLR